MSTALSGGRQRQPDNIYPVEEVPSELPGFHQQVKVPVGGAYHPCPDRHGIIGTQGGLPGVPGAPGAASPAWACSHRLSRQGTGFPRRRRRTLPSLALSAPVKAPFSYPKSSDSRRVSGSAPQFTARKGSPALGPSECTALASTSLPVPVSPCIRTVEGDAATAGIRLNSCAFQGFGSRGPLRCISP